MKNVFLLGPEITQTQIQANIQQSIDMMLLIVKNCLMLNVS